VSGVWWDGLCKTFARVEQSSTAQNQILNLHMFIQSSDFLVFLCPSNCPVPLSRSRCLFLLVPLHLRRQTSEAGCHAPQVAPLHPRSPMLPSSLHRDARCATIYAHACSAPLIYARVLEKAALAPGKRVLCVGSGTGYLCAIAAELVRFHFLQLLDDAVNA
jgi:hypothetical protein